ncbi:MAG TPA: hypothetical protein VFU22_03805 [Roseiflexaceae bacterium]|nr:hypothetical protein [Roseiflexaceae bacterium]
MNTIIGMFDDPQTARRAFETLRDGPLPIEDISLIAPNADGNVATGSSEDVSAGEGAAVGAVWGGLVGLAALLIPGVGPFVAFGALGAALTGAVTGAVVGGISAALIDFSGIPEEDARGYEEQIRTGKTLVAVKVRDENTAEARRILNEIGADTVRDDQTDLNATVRRPVRVAMYDEQGQRLGEERAIGATTRQRGIYDAPGTTADMSGQAWTSGEFVGEGQGSGRRRDTGKYDADQWVGETQQPGHTPSDTWTSGEVVGEGQGSGPRTDTGEYDSRQWVGEGQGDRPVTDDTPKRTS